MKKLFVGCFSQGAGAGEGPGFEFRLVGVGVKRSAEF